MLASISLLWADWCVDERATHPASVAEAIQQVGFVTVSGVVAYCFLAADGELWEQGRCGEIKIVVVVDLIFMTCSLHRIVAACTVDLHSDLIL